jgi:hypothetical protein
MNSEKEYTMGVKEYFLILGAVALGAVPGVFAYRYLDANDEALLYMAGATYATTHVQQQELVRVETATPAGQDMVLVSRPEKTDDTLCPHSYYVTSVLSVVGDVATIQQTCESKRDAGYTWSGAASGWEFTTEDGNTETMELLVFADDADIEGARVVLTRTGGIISVDESTVAGITPTTSFVPYMHVAAGEPTVPVLEDIEKQLVL